MSPGTVDWELLADHLGGALTGTPQEAEVTRRVATDPAWAQAVAELAGAFDAVAVDLRGLPEPTMPAEVTARLDTALRTAGAAPAPAAGPRPGAAPAGRPAGEVRRPPGRSSRSRSRLTRWGAGVAVAAGVMAFTAVGLHNWQLGAEFTGGDSAADAPADTLEAEPPAELIGEPELLASGLDYQPGVLRRPTPPAGPSLHAERDSGDLPGPGEPGIAATGEPVPPPLPPELVSLWGDPQLRAACLAAVAAEFSPPPASIEAVDFARFEGEAALVIWVTAADASQWVSISGPACGSLVSGADQRFVYPRD